MDSLLRLVFVALLLLVVDEDDADLMTVACACCWPFLLFVVAVDVGVGVAVTVTCCSAQQGASDASDWLQFVSVCISLSLLDTAEMELAACGCGVKAMLGVGWIGVFISCLIGVF